MKKSHNYRRRGVAYVTTLGIASLVAVMSVGSLVAVRSLGKSVDSGNDVNEALNNAITATEMARLWIKNDPNWRTNYTNNVSPWVKSPTKVQDGKFFVTLVDPVDGNLTNNLTDPVLVVGSGQKGAAKQRIQVQLNSSVAPLTCLQSAAVAGNGITVNMAATLSGSKNTTYGKPVTSNKNVVNTMGTVAQLVEYVGTKSGNYSVAPKQITTPLTLPDPATVFTYYLQTGTQISPSGNPMTLQKGLLSATANTFGGGKNAQGIYIIDCQNKQMIIQNCRIVGTLVLLNPGTGSVIQGSVNWMPPAPGFPCLLVKGGTVGIKLSLTKLAESPTDNVNYNPPGTPDESGSTNTTVASTEQYSSGILGMVYVNSDVAVSTASTVYNLICSGTLSISGTFYPGYDPNPMSNPPPGFSGGSVSLLAGSYARQID